MSILAGSINSELSRTVGVRMTHSHEATWRPALSNKAPLLIAATDGPTDAPDWLPAGGACARRGSFVRREP